jgi:hypothetical protein
VLPGFMAAMGWENTITRLHGDLQEGYRRLTR